MMKRMLVPALAVGCPVHDPGAVSRVGQAGDCRVLPQVTRLAAGCPEPVQVDGPAEMKTMMNMTRRRLVQAGKRGHAPVHQGRDDPAQACPARQRHRVREDRALAVQAVGYLDPVQADGLPRMTKRKMSMTRRRLAQVDYLVRVQARQEQDAPAADYLALPAQGGLVGYQVRRAQVALEDCQDGSEGLEP